MQQQLDAPSRTTTRHRRGAGPLTALLCAAALSGCDAASPRAELSNKSPSKVEPAAVASGEQHASKALKFPSADDAAAQPAALPKLNVVLKSAARATVAPAAATPTASSAASPGSTEGVQVASDRVDVAAFAAAIPEARSPGDKDAVVATSLTAEPPLQLTTPQHRSTPVVASVTLRQVDVQNAKALQLVMRGALFSARAEYQTALEMTAAALDAQESTRARALQAAGVALVEAEDFVPRSAKAGAEPNAATIVESHRSGIVTDAEAKSVTAAVAHQAYLEFARRQLVVAMRGAACGSVALHGLGKVLAAIAQQNPDAVADARRKAEVYYQAALDVEPQNFPAANDLAVLLAEDGRLEQARSLLQTGIRVSPQPAMWNNLATIHARLGEHQLAAAARWEAQARSTAAGSAGSGILPTHDVRWVDTATFAAAARPDTAIRNGAQPAAASAAQSAASRLPTATSALPPVQTVQQPRRASLVN